MITKKLSTFLLGVSVFCQLRVSKWVPNMKPNSFMMKKQLASLVCLSAGPAGFVLSETNQETAAPLSLGVACQFHVATRTRVQYLDPNFLPHLQASTSTQVSGERIKPPLCMVGFQCRFFATSVTAIAAQHKQDVQASQRSKCIL